jgi:Fe-S-cluster containining protein
MAGVAQQDISCDNCRAVCCRLQVLLIGDNDVPESMIEWSDWGGQVMRREADGWCTALDRDTMRCSIYSRRPQLCRDYAMGGSECIAERAIHGEEG